ncbi:MAG: ATP-binding protein, partial [Thermoanaerobaculia bacterium]
MSTSFVGRERELALLSSFLDAAQAGSAKTCFVAGEAGAGKSTLIEALTARAESRDANLVVAVGSCNAHTGIGDPYLPFLDLLNQLTGNVEAKVKQGAISEGNASRLRRIGNFSMTVLIECAPDLIGTLIPGSSLIVGAARAMAERAGLLDRLTGAPDSKESPASVDQKKIMESYTAILRNLAARVPLVIVLDDLQWADAASCALFFHLAQNLHDARVLVIGTYRPNDLALGRGGERHPLMSVINELKRYRGDIVIDLDAADETQRRAFVSELIDAEPNLLDAAFRDRLYAHTRGHALFTIELLRALQERGCIARNEDGKWRASDDLEWSVLPSRVEGVIEERIGRLEEKLRDLLRAASVEGESFTVEVLARIGEISERALLKALADDLERRHQLVTEGEVEKVGRSYVSHYFFAHALFQQYLYNGLSRRERMILHGEVADLLEQLYETRPDLVTVQLARHYRLAGDDEKALTYTMDAARRALRIGAFVEALAHLDVALGLVRGLPPAEGAARELDVQVGRAAAVKAIRSWDAPEVAAIYERCRELTAITGPTPQIAPILFGHWAMTLFHLRLHDAWEIAADCARVGEVLGSSEVMLQARLAQANTRFWMGDFVSTLEMTEDAARYITEDAYAERLGQDPRSFLLMFGMFSSWLTGSPEAADAKRAELHALCKRIGHTFTTAIALQATAWQSCHERDAATALADASRLIVLCEENQFPFYHGIGKVLRAWATTIGGGDGLAEAEEGHAEVTKFGGHMLDSMYAVIIAEACLNRDEAGRGLEIVDEAIVAARETGFGAYLAELHRIRGEL